MVLVQHSYNIENIKLLVPYNTSLDLIYNPTKFYQVISKNLKVNIKAGIRFSLRVFKGNNSNRKQWIATVFACDTSS